MTSIVVDFAEALSTVSRPSAFFVAGAQQVLAPGLKVEGVGPVALPLLPNQAEQLIAAADPAPYGRGEETLTDTSVRRTWQIGAERVRIAAKHWPQSIGAIIARIADGLGIANPIQAELYKLLIYDQGSFFVAHRDTEKLPGMFATLVLALPSVCEGGELIVRHQQREARLDLRCDEPSDVVYAGFFADCLHEVLPITAGYRLVLVYNLLRQGGGPPPRPPNYDDEQAALTAVLKQWAETPCRDHRPHDHSMEDNDDNLADRDAEPDKLIYPLQHAYTPAELGFHTLKGADAAIAPVVAEAARRAGCDLHLALITIEESGIAQYNGDYNRSRYDDDDEDGDDEFEIVEACERQATASNWRRPDGAPSPLGDLPIDDREFSPPIDFEHLEPDEQHFQEATGNEGASYERSYQRAALILWPHQRLLTVVNHAGPDVALPFLEHLVDRAIVGAESSAAEQAGELSAHMLSSWPRNDWYPRREDQRSNAGRFLGQLVRLADTTGTALLLAALVNRRGLDVGDCTDIADALELLPRDQAATLAVGLIDSAATASLAACAALLVRIAERDRAAASGAGRTLVAALPSNPTHIDAAQEWRRGPGIRPAFIVDLLTALGRIDPTLAAVSVDHLLDWPATYDFDAVLVPAVRTLLGTPQTAEQAAVRQLRDACIAHLDSRIGLPLDAPRDWQRDKNLGCNCRDCQGLAAYLGDAAQPVWVFAAAEARRRHVEATIRAARCDVDMATEKRGSPHRLICTKNQASYQRRCEQRASDLADRARLTA